MGSAGGGRVSEPCRHAPRAVLAPNCFNRRLADLSGLCYDAFMNIRYSPLSDFDASRFSEELRPGQVGTSSGGIFVARREDIFALADELAEEELLQEMSSYGKRTTGIDNTIWISPRGNTRHARASRSLSTLRTQSSQAVRTQPSLFTTVRL